MEKLYKVLGPTGMSCHGGDMQWSLPKDGCPGDWMPPIKGPLVPCKNGYHIVTSSQLINWLGPRIFEVETRCRGVDFIRLEDKIIVRDLRIVKETKWNGTNARLFTCDCAEHVLDKFQSKYKNDLRVRDCIETIRKFALGCATKAELDAARAAARAARVAAWAAAEAAAEAATGAAEWAAAEVAAEAAAEAAAEVATRAAEWTAAWAAEKQWQSITLQKYL